MLFGKMHDYQFVNMKHHIVFVIEMEHFKWKSLLVADSHMPYLVLYKCKSHEKIGFGRIN